MANKNENMFLYWGSGSPPCWAAMLTLAEKGMWKGLPNKLISFAKKEHKSAEVTAINPRGQAPTFKDGDVVVNESVAICLYLEEKYTDTRLLPTDVDQRALVYQKMFECPNLMSKISVPIVYYKRMTKKENWDENLLKEKMGAAEAELAIWDGYLDGKDYLACGQFTLADALFFPLLALYVRLGLKLEKNKNLKRYYESISQRASAKETWPPHWSEPAEGPGPLDDLKA